MIIRVVAKAKAWREQVSAKVRTWLSEAPSRAKAWWKKNNPPMWVVHRIVDVFIVVICHWLALEILLRIHA